MIFLTNINTVRMEYENLTNHFLIAMPNLADPNFSKTVTYICAHNEEGAMGIIINRPTDLNLGEVLSQMELETNDKGVELMPVFHGGPVQTDRGFILHDPGFDWDSSLSVSQQVDMTTSRDVLQAIAGGDGPKDIFIALGYAGWSAGQLEEEIVQNAWLSGPARSDIIFKTPIQNRWHSAAALLGVSIENLSSDIGHA